MQRVQKSQLCFQYCERKYYKLLKMSDFYKFTSFTRIVSRCKFKKGTDTRKEIPESYRYENTLQGGKLEGMVEKYSYANVQNKREDKTKDTNKLQNI